MAIRKEKRDRIVAQAITEIDFARRHKQGKVPNWQKNEQMYFGKKEKTEDARANVDLGRMQEHVHTILSKIDTPLTFSFEKKKESQLKRTQRLNSLKDYDADRDFWDIKDIVGKKQAIIYGRAIYSYYASSENGYTPHLDPVDVYDFLIDPSAGGIDIERARYMGRYGVVKDRYELESNKDYIQSELADLLAGKGNNTTKTQEEINKRNRSYALAYSQPEKEIDTPDKFVFWEWFTTFEGKRYYLLMDERRAIKCVELPDLFEYNEWPFWTYAPFPDLTEFWTPGYCDYVREIFMAQAVSINQMLDNAEQINKPQKIVDVSAFENLADLKYRRGGNTIKAKVGTDLTKAFKLLETPSIQTPIQVFQTLESIQERSSGVTAGVAGVADTDGRATIYEGNQANVADRFGLFNKSYAFGYKRFGRLYEHGVREHLNRKIAIDILGPDGIDVESVSKGDIFRKNDEFGLITRASNAELSLSEQKKRSLAAFYSSLIGNPVVNQQEVIQQLGLISGAEQGDVQRLLDVTNYGEAEIMSEAERDIEDILDGGFPQPNRRANAAYKQRFVDYMNDHMPGERDGMDAESFERMVQYVMSLDEVIVGNTVRQAREDANAQMSQQLGGEPNVRQTRIPGPAQPLQDVMQENV
jgi:hypothetical protein